MSEKESKGKSPDAEEVKEIMEAIQSTVPQLISQLVQAIYSPKMAESIAESVGTLYQGLKKKGLPDEMVLEMTRNYMKIMDLPSLISDSMRRGSSAEDIGEEIERRVRRKLKEKE